MGTEKSKSAIQTAARGLGLPVEVGQYLAGLIPSDRGMIRTLKQCYHGDEKEGMKPVTAFVQEMKKYPELWNTAQRIEGLVCRSGIHAGGLVFVDEPFTETSALMRAPDGTIISQFDLHDLEKMSLIKYDLLSIEAIDKIQTCLDLLIKYGYIEDKGNLRDTYEAAIGVYNLERDAPEMWEMLWNHKIQSCFQMEKDSGIQGIALTKPQSVDDLATLNSVIRLMAQEKGGEQPLNKYARFKQNIDLWYQEMDAYGLTKEEQKILEPILKISYGICESQERFMMLVQIPECGGFDLNFADRLRKSVAKKDPAGYKECERIYFERVKERGLSKNLCNYVWNVCVATSRGYGFNLSHTLAYSLVALQEMNLAYKNPIIFWDCANLIVDSGAVEGVEDKSANYDKIAIAVNKVKNNAHTQVSLVDLNKSERSFAPDVENNTIYYGIAGVQGVGNAVIQSIISNRPYNSLQDFLEKTNCNKTATISLIKAGAFDQFGERGDIMREYLGIISNPKKRITLQNFAALIEHKLIPAELDFQRRTFQFNKLLKQNCKDGDYYVMRSTKYMTAYENNFDVDMLEPHGEKLAISQKNWKKQYDKAMQPAKDYIKEHQEELLNALNESLVQEIWEKDAAGSYSHWEMESLGMYYHDHELAPVKDWEYGIAEFNALSEDPIVDYTFRDIPVYKTYRIAGTVIAKDDMHSSISILTKGSGVVNVKMTRDMFAMYNRRISEIQKDGTKKVQEQGWFQRGTLVLLNGFRRQNTFVLKAYKKDRKAGRHQMCKIYDVSEDGEIQYTHLRYGMEQ